MQYVASLDIGTTSVKGVLIGQDGSLFGRCEVALETIYKENGFIEQDPAQWWTAFKTITSKWWQLQISPQGIAMVTFSGQMQDCIPIDDEGKSVRPAILYADSRAGNQAMAINHQFTNIQKITGNHFDGSMPFPKIKWMQENEPKKFKQTRSFLISSKDFVINRLTGEKVTDPTSGATTGMMVLQNRQWFYEAVEAQGVNPDLLPQLVPADEIAGYVSKEAAESTGLVIGTPVLCGVGDAGATTMGAGVVHAGDRYAYLGTTGWIAMATNATQTSEHGVFHLAHLPAEYFIKVAPLMNAGNAHRWAMRLFSDSNLTTLESYRQFEQMMEHTSPGANGVLFLPYLNGERCPIQDANATGSFVRLTASTRRDDMSRAVLEGVAFSIRQSLAYLSAADDKPLTLVGGGSRSQTWCQILADVCQADVTVPDDAEYLPSLGAASAAFIQLGWVKNYGEFVKEIIDQFPRTHYVPIAKNVDTYHVLYDDFLKLYPALKSFSRTTNN